MDEEGSPFTLNRYTHLTPRFMDRIQALLRELDPLGLWQTRYPGFITHCLDAIDEFFGRLKGYMDKEPQELVTEALFVAFRAHGLTLRKSKDALFFEHPLATADHLATYQLDAHTLAAALLHDVAEDAEVSIPQIVEQFGADVGKLVDGVTKLRATGKEVTSQLQQDRIRVGSINKLFRFMVDDVRVVLIKLADRQHNMQTLGALPQDKQWEKAHEVLDVYAPLAYRMGMWDVKSELEELALRALRPKLYAGLKTLMERRARKQCGRLESARRSLRDCLAKAGLEARIEPAPEQIYSAGQQFLMGNGILPRLSDIIRLTVLVNCRCECYQALCVIHELWTPAPGTFDDYIAHPRENLYQSLHTTVFGPDAKPLKIRIRTREMHQVAHYGILTRWSAGTIGQSEGLEKQIERLLVRLQPVEELIGREDRLAAYREALTDQIQVFTPKGRLIELPAGSTPLDFAYQIHTKLGDEARSARINGVPRPLDTPLQNGDQVHIVRYKGELPLREWLDKDLGFAQTVYARNKIRRAFRQLDGEQAVSIGREALQREMELMGLDDYDLDAIAQALNYRSAEQLLIAIARADLAPHRVTHLAIKPVWEALDATPVGGVVLSPDGPLTVRGVPGRPVKLCGTCQPIPGDPIVGNLLRGGQVTVHRMDCHHIAPTARRGSRLNLLEVDWAREPRTVRPVHICVAAVDRSGLAHDVTCILELEHVNICELYGRSDSDCRVGLVTLTAEVTSLRQLSRILHRFARLLNVKAVCRVSSLSHGQDAAMQWAIENVQDPLLNH